MSVISYYVKLTQKHSFRTASSASGCRGASVQAFAFEISTDSSRRHNRAGRAQAHDKNKTRSVLKMEKRKHNHVIVNIYT